MNKHTTLKESDCSYTIKVAGVKIHCNEAGEGKPLLCIHGGGPGASAWSNFKQNIPAITAAGYRMLMMDMPGYGKSEFDDGTKEDFFDYMGCMLEDFLQAIGIGDAVDVIGNSLGGQAALGRSEERRVGKECAD